MKWYLMVLKKYATFSGRARRKEYWMFTLFSIIFSYLTLALDYGLFETFLPMGIGILNVIYSLIVFLPGLAVTVRRLHDVGKSGWMIFILLIPVIGWIWFFVLLVKSGDSGENKYGKDPKNEMQDGDLEALDSDLVNA